MTNYHNILKQQLPELQAKYLIGFLAFFDSSDRDDFNDKKSDLDILVDFTGDDAMLFLQLAEKLETITKKLVDLVTFRSLKPRQWEFLKKNIIYV
jgi:predicted nucleotidyltransferase